MANTIFQQSLLPSPDITDVIPIGHQADGKGYSVTLQSIGNVIGGGGGFAGVLPINTNATALTIYNYAQYGALQTAAAATNTTAMNNMITAINAANPIGGWVWIPKYNYSINFASGGYLLPYNTFLWGLGGGGTGVGGGASSYHFTMTAGDGTLFSAGGGAHSSGGNYFFGLSSIATATLTSTCCIYAAGWNPRAMKCNFVNWPVAFFADGLSSGMEQCTVQYNSGPAGTGTTTVNGTLMPAVSGANIYAGSQPVMCILSSPQAYVIGPGEYLKKNGASPANTVGIGIGGNSGDPAGGGVVEHGTIRDIHLSQFQWGISYLWNIGTIQTNLGNFAAYAGSNGAKFTTVTGVEVDSFSSAVLMACPFNANIFNEKYVGCLFQRSDGSTDNSAIVYIDPLTSLGNSNSAIFDIEFTNCSVINAQDHSTLNCYGYNIVGGDSIRILGGNVCNMGATGGANIVVGGANNVSIIGVRLQPGVPAAINGVPNSPSQYAVLINGTPGGKCLISDCIMTGYSGSPISVTGTINQAVLFVINCPGYNDQNTPINTVANIGTAAQQSYNQTANSGTSYYGPSYVLYTANAGGGTLKISGGAAFTLAANQTGSFFLNSPYDSFQFSLAPAAIQWYGK